MSQMSQAVQISHGRVTHKSIKRVNHSVQTGVVLITVMVILVIASFIAIDIQSNLFYLTRVSTHDLVKSQAMAYVKGAESLSMLALKTDYDNDQTNNRDIDHESEEWAIVQSFPVDGGLIEGRLIDRQGRFNLNELENNEKAQAVFLRLLGELGIPSDTAIQAQDLLDAYLDWTDQDQEVRGISDTEDYFYFGLTRAYRTAGRSLSHLSELRLIRGFHEEDIRKLAPYVTLLPVGTPININSIQVELARALNPDNGETLVGDRPVEGYALSDLETLPQAQQPALAYTSKSQFFELRTQIELGDERFRARSYLFRPKVVDQLSPVRIMGRDSGDLRFSI